MRLIIILFSSLFLCISSLAEQLPKNSLEIMHEASALPDLGRELPLQMDSTGIPKHFYVTTILDFDFTWGVRFNSSLTKNEINKLPSPIYWNLWNSKTETFLFTNWLSTAEEGSADTQVLLYGFTYGKREDPISQKNVITIWRNLSKSKLVFVYIDINNNYKPLYFVDLEALCAKYPQRFVTVPRGQVGCNGK